MTHPTRIVLPQPGPDVPDEQLAAWRDAVSRGGLPDPTRSRWVPLRAGVVAMWEYDVAEYWFADGRAQLVGMNQSGKSTLMTLTTLIMLQGDLSSYLIDTFGESGKRFRYYVEPTEHHKDRRDTSRSTNRGWVWVEYGRLTKDGTPEFFTTLLYAQTKRGVQDITRTWITCRGAARVRAGIDLVAGQSAYEPKDLAGVDGLVPHRDGPKDYAGRIATELFGFTDLDRYRTVLKMLRSLRTPNLGKVLDADFFTGQMRSALPPLDKDEVEELASSWQQVEQLGRDRDDADNARAAITAYVTRTWRPWADAVLRLHADAVLDTAAAVDASAAKVKVAKAALDTARKQLTAETERTTELQTALGYAHDAHGELLQSVAYGNAVGRADEARHLRATAQEAERRAAEAIQVQDRAQAEHDQALTEQQDADAALTAVRELLADATRHMIAAATAAGLGEQASAWASDGDTDRLDAAVSARRRHVAALRNLLRVAADAVAKYRAAYTLAGEREQELTGRQEVADQAAVTLSDGLQDLSDELERWADRLAEFAPPVADRERWLQLVTAQAAAPRPRQLMKLLITQQWLDPAMTPLTEQVSQLRTEAATAVARADDADRNADELENAGDPQPLPPSGWTRRSRPTDPSPEGAPLWRLVDPEPVLDKAVLDQVEAALAAAGLLDAWVTPDGLWRPGRDGDDIVAGIPDPTPGPSLATILRPAADAGELTGTVTAILAGISYATADQPILGPSGVADDGRFWTPTLQGRAGRSSHGAELIGTAARTARIRRDIADLRRTADEQRRVALQLTGTADEVAARIAALRDAAGNAPDDADVTGAGAALSAANLERDRAQRLHGEAVAAARTLEIAADDANGHVITFASGNDLPTTADQLENVTVRVDAAAQAASGLRLASRERDSAERSAASAITQAGIMQRRFAAAQQSTTDLAAVAARAGQRADTAEASIDQDDQELFTRKLTYERQISDLTTSISLSNVEGLRLSGTASAADLQWQRTVEDQAVAEQARTEAFTSWWTPVDVGLAAARNLPEPAERDLRDAISQAQTAVQMLRPTAWPGTTAEKVTRVNTLMSRVVGNQVSELRAQLEAYGGRSVSVIEADDTRPLPAVVMAVDSTGQQLGPTDAIRKLDELVGELSASHDDKLNTMYTELLSSTFIDHLADRLKAVITLLKNVNDVLRRHPTGADRMTLRLRRHPAADHQAGFKILKAIEDGAIASETAQQQIRLFLADRLQLAQETPPAPSSDKKSVAEEWVDRVAALLDYRSWFDVVCEFRIGAHDDEPGRWQPLTKQEHTTDSGGGKAVTLLQPLLATLVTLYSDSPDTPRPLWLDEAFVGVDLANQATMMRMLVDFDLDLLIAGPTALIATPQVPAAALWHVARAPLPLPGVDLSLTLWAGQERHIVPVADVATKAFQKARTADPLAGPDLFTGFETPTSNDDPDDAGDQDHQADAVGMPEVART